MADAPHHSAQRLWDRFKTAIDFIRSRCEVYFAQLRQERSTNLAAKAALIEQAEALADSTDWSKTAARFQELQKAWEDTGPVPRDAARNLAQRFRAACNAFFTRRRDALSSKKKEWNENLARKEALCERAEQLAESTDWDAAASELKKLQAEWKAIGPVRHDKSEVVWNRFRSAADKFFERYHNRHKIAAAEKIAEHAALVVALEGLVALEEAPADLAAQVQTLRTTISNAPHVEGAGDDGASRTVEGRACRAGRAVAGRVRWARTSTLSRSMSAWKSSSRRSSARSRKKRPSRRRTSPPPSCSRSGCDRRSRAMRWVFAPTIRSGAPPASTVEEAQDAWRRIALVPGEDTRALEAQVQGRLPARHGSGEAARPPTDGWSRRRLSPEAAPGAVPVERDAPVVGVQGARGRLEARTRRDESMVPKTYERKRDGRGLAAPDAVDAVKRSTPRRAVRVFGGVVRMRPASGTCGRDRRGSRRIRTSR